MELFYVFVFLKTDTLLQLIGQNFKIKATQKTLKSYQTLSNKKNLPKTPIDTDRQQNQCLSQIFITSKSYQNKSSQINLQFMTFTHQLGSKLSFKKVFSLSQNSIDSQLVDSMDQWTHAGNHHGLIKIDSNPLNLIVNLCESINTYSLKLVQVQYKVQKDINNLTSSTEKQKPVGKQSLYLKNYINKFKLKNLHRFQQKSHISPVYTLEYEVFIQNTSQALQRIVFQHQKLTSRIRPINNSHAESVVSDNFSDKNINQIEVKGENRLSEHVTFVSPNALLGSQSKIEPQELAFSSLNNKIPNKIVRGNKSNLVLKMNKVPMTDRKYNKSHNNHNNQQDQNQDQDSTLQSPQLQSINLKKLSSQQVKPLLELLSPVLLKPKRLPFITDRIQKYETDEQKRRKLMQDFEIKRIQFKRRIQENKQKGKYKQRPQTDRLNKKRERKMSRSSSTRSMRTVRLSELQKLPQQKPWVRKQKEIVKVRNKKIMYYICVLMLFVVYFIMQPFKNVEQQLVLTKGANQNRQRIKRQKPSYGKNRFKLKEIN